MGVKSVKRGHKVSLDASASNAIARAVDTRKVAAFTIGAAGVLAGAALAFSVTPANTAMAAEEKDSQVVQSDAQKGEPHKHEQQANDKQSSDKQIQKKNVTETPKNQMGGVCLLRRMLSRLK